MLCRAVGLVKSLQESSGFNFSFVPVFVGRLCLNSLLISPSGCWSGAAQLCPGDCPLPAVPVLALGTPGHALAQMLSVLSLVTLSGFTLSSQVQLGLRAGVLGTSSSSDYPSLPPSARESRAGCFHSPAPAVREVPLGKGFCPLPAPDPGGAAQGGDRDQPSRPVAPKQLLLHFPKAGLDPLSHSTWAGLQAPILP